MSIKQILCCLFLACAIMACDSSDPGTVPDAALDAADEGCRDSTECTGSTFCVGPNDVNCGIPPREECQIDQDCAAPGDVCHAIADSCSGDGVGSFCGPPCTQPDECGAGFTCDAQGACRPIACDAAEFECRPSEICDPSSVDPGAPVPEITHGCVNIQCADDAPCPGATVCVNGYCQDGPGVCSLPAP
jgi:hypothetical protein